nr:hypothetical protein GZ1D1_45 [uncultured archaeon GZfos1D1]
MRMPLTISGIVQLYAGGLACLSGAAVMDLDRVGSLDVAYQRDLACEVRIMVMKCMSMVFCMDVRSWSM